MTSPQTATLDAPRLTDASMHRDGIDIAVDQLNAIWNRLSYRIDATRPPQRILGQRDDPHAKARSVHSRLLKAHDGLQGVILDLRAAQGRFE